MTKLTWKQFDDATKRLATAIKKSRYKPDYIIGITSGGLIPLGLLAKRLGVYDILTVSARSYDGKKRKKLEITYLPDISLKGKKVLVVDEITDSGDTLEAIVEVLKKKYKVARLKSATVVVNVDHCKFYPDFWAIEKKGDWVVFPWDA